LPVDRCKCHYTLPKLEISVLVNFEGNGIYIQITTLSGYCLFLLSTNQKVALFDSFEYYLPTELRDGWVAVVLHLGEGSHAKPGQ
jgi:hypothetical protein